MIAPDDERIVRDAAIAQHAYWQLVRRAAENPRYRLALMDHSIRITAELQGKPRPHLAPPVELELTVAQDVDRRLAVIRPQLEIDVIHERARKRAAYGCGPVQLQLGYIAGMRRRLKQLLNESELTIGEFAAAIGVAARTIERQLDGATIPESRKQWLRAVQSIRRGRNGHVQIEVRTRASAIARPRRRKAS